MFTSKIPDGNHLKVRYRTDKWEVIEADRSGSYPEKARPSDGTGLGGTVARYDTKDDAVTNARGRMHRFGHPYLIIEDVSGGKSVSWNNDFDSIDIRWQDDKWRLTWNDQFIGSDSRRGDLEDRAKEVQEEHGFRYLRIYKKDGGLYWERQHPHWRGQS